MRFNDTKYPWRYVCENCGSTQIHKRQSTPSRFGKRDSVVCDNCGVKSKEVYDKKKGYSIAV